MGVFFEVYLFKKIIGFVQPFSTLKSARKHIWKRRFNTHRRSSTRDARKLSILPGVLFCQIVSNRPECRHNLIYASPCLCYATRAPPRKSESVSSHIQIFGGGKMNKTNLHEICVKKFSYVAWALPRYHVSLTPESDGKGVSA